MPNYIRLKNRIAKIEAEDSECYYFNKLKKFVYKDEGYKTANTPEELCDEFVRICERFNIRELLNKQEKEDLLNRKLKTNKITYFYGAIWTSKGIIYVAKMNNEGVFKLRWKVN